MVKIALLDGQPFCREGFARLAVEQADIAIVGTAGTLEEGLGLLAGHGTDVVVCEMTLPGGAPFEAVREILRRWPGQRILVLATQARAEYAAEAMLLGASGYALTTDAPPVLFDAARTVARGEPFVTPRIAREAVETLLHKRRANGGAHPLRVLSQREREVFRLLVHGDGNRTIASRLGISVRTVETHRAHILRKLEQHSLSGLVRIAVEQGVFLQEEQPTSAS